MPLHPAGARAHDPAVRGGAYVALGAHLGQSVVGPGWRSLELRVTAGLLVRLERPRPL
ncbi:MAG: hypothetical protein KDA24_30220 [Deltaproteobacteria bacterium]|nr:hypothetical protein [Deltaproteobacteria bacterium]